MKNKISKFMIIAALFIGMAFIYLFSFKESEEFTGFPVPKGAELTEKESKLEKYNWASASEENGLPLRYQLIIKLWGWDKREQMGALTIYEKNGEEVGVVSLEEYFSVSVE